MKKRSLSLMLALLMLASASTACSDATNEETNTPAETAPVSDTAADTENLSDYDKRQLIPDELPDVKYGGQSFRVMTYDNSSYGNGGYEIVSEELNGDACNDAVYNRNLDIESRFEVKIECTPDAEPHNTIKTMVTAGSNDYEIVGMFNYLSYYPLNAKAGYNWLEVPNVNLDKPWHNKLSNENATINGRLYSICSDLAVTSMTYTYAFFFNISMMENYGYPSAELYSMVKEGEWTLDNVKKITENIYEDTNGNGNADNEDIYGFGYYIMNPADVWLAAFDQPICSISEEGTLEVTIMSDKTVSILEKLNDWHYNSDGFTILPNQYDEEDFFLKGKLAMAPLRFFTAYNVLRDMEDPYSILPYPKFDSAQDTYYTNADDKFTAFIVPITAYGNLDFVGTIYEALCAESYKKVYPEYYDTALKGKYSSEPETVEMIDLIMEGRNFDFSFQFGGSHFQDLPYMIRELLQDNSSDIASKYKKVEKAIKKNVKNKLLALYEDAE